MDWECLTDVVSTEFLKFAIASPASSSADLHGQPHGCEVCHSAYAWPLQMCAQLQPIVDRLCAQA